MPKPHLNGPIPIFPVKEAKLSLHDPKRRSWLRDRMINDCLVFDIGLIHSYNCATSTRVNISILIKTVVQVFVSNIKRLKTGLSIISNSQ